MEIPGQFSAEIDSLPLEACRFPRAGYAVVGNPVWHLVYVRQATRGSRVGETLSAIVIIRQRSQFSNKQQLSRHLLPKIASTLARDKILQSKPSQLEAF